MLMYNVFAKTRKCLRNKKIMLYNDHKCNYPGLWLVNIENSQNYEIESFFEIFYPREIPSNQNFIDIIIKYFPEVIDENDDGISIDANDEDDEDD